jgi:hypothetical protein
MLAMLMLAMLMLAMLMLAMLMLAMLIPLLFRSFLRGLTSPSLNTQSNISP